MNLGPGTLNPCGSKRLSKTEKKLKNAKWQPSHEVSILVGAFYGYNYGDMNK